MSDVGLFVGVLGASLGFVGALFNVVPLSGRLDPEVLRANEWARRQGPWLWRVGVATSAVGLLLVLVSLS